MRRPAGRSRAGEHRGRERGGTSATSSTTADQNSTFVSSGRSGDFCAQRRERRLLELFRDVVPRRAELLRRPAQQPGARILGAVDAVAEAHQPLAAVEQVVDVAVDVAGLCGGVEHRQHPCGRAAVERPGERADCRGERRRAVGAGRGDDPGGEGRGVEAVLGGADPVGVDRLHVLGVGLAAPLEQEALGGRSALRDRLRGDPVRLAVRDPRRLGRDRDELRREAAEVLARLVVRDVDQLLEIPLGADAGRHRLQIGRRVARQAAALVRLRRRQTGLEALVDEEAPDLLERYRPTSSSMSTPR